MSDGGKRTKAKTILADRRTESVGILGRRRRRRSHSVLWTDQACLCRRRTSQQTGRRDRANVFLYPRTQRHTIPGKQRCSSAPSCTGSISIRTRVWKRKETGIKLYPQKRLSDEPPGRKKDLSVRKLNSKVNNSKVNSVLFKKQKALGAGGSKE